MTTELEELWRSITEEFPQPEEPAIGGAAGGGAAAGGAAAGGAAVGTGAPQLEAPGTQFATRAAFEAAGWKIVKQSPSAVEHVPLVLARKGDGDGLWHLFFENTTDSNIKIPGGTWVGKGGPGSFVSTTDIPSAKDAYKWHFTRLTDYKKDTAKYANANIVLSAGGGEEPAVPKMVTPAQAEEVLGTSALGEGGVVKVYGHATTKGARMVKLVPSDRPLVAWVPTMAESADAASFAATNVGQWLRSRDVQVDGKIQFESKGLLRPCFEVVFKPTEKLLRPSNHPDANPLNFFTKEPLSLRSKHLCSL